MLVTTVSHLHSQYTGKSGTWEEVGQFLPTKEGGGSLGIAAQRKFMVRSCHHHCIQPHRFTNVYEVNPL